jgi:transcriptional regulator with XRE-family HTH domain
VRTPGGALRDCRRALKFTQRAFAKQIGVSTRTLSRWEFDDHHPPIAERNRVMTWVAHAPPALVRTLAYAWQVAVPPQAALPPPEPPAPPPLEAALYDAAEEHDIGPRRLRAAIIHLLRAIERTQLTPTAAREQLEARAKRAPTSAKT